MNNLKTAGVWVVAIILIISNAIIIFRSTPEVKQGSVSIGNEYHGYFFNPSNLQGSNNEIISGPGSLNTVVITTLGAGSFNLYDASTTDVTKRANVATSSLRIVASFAASQAVGTYGPYDQVFYNGLVRGDNGAVGTSTINARSN